MTENVVESVTEDENVTSDLAEEVVSAVHKSQQLTIATAKKSQQATIEMAKKIAEALSTAASTAAAKLPGRQLAHRLPAPPFADGLPKLPKLPETGAVRTAARDYASQLFAEQRRFAGEVVAEQRRFGRQLVSAVSAPRTGSETDEAGETGETAPSAE
jgi:hypothetical protein